MRLDIRGHAFARPLIDPSGDLLHWDFRLKKDLNGYKAQTTKHHARFRPVDGLYPVLFVLDRADSTVGDLSENFHALLAPVLACRGFSARDGFLSLEFRRLADRRCDQYGVRRPRSLGAGAIRLSREASF